MTTNRLEPAQGLEAYAAGFSRSCDLARRALRALDAAILDPADDASQNIVDSASLRASIVRDGAPVATLVVYGEAGRVWSEDDRAVIEGVAAMLSETIRLSDQIVRLETDLPRVASDLDEVPTTALDVPSDETRAAEASEFRRILLADDLDLNRKLIADMLSLDGYIVDSVADGAAAIEAVKATSYDLILMDMIMPGMDGMEATRAIRALPAPACDVPIVALTAHSFREQLDNCLHAGMNATLTKPMSFDALSNAVSTWVRSRPQAA